MINRIKKSDFVRDIGITTGGQLIVMLFTFLLNKIVSIRFGPTQYMEYSLIHKTAGVITYVMILSLGIAIPRYIAIYRSKQEKNKEFICLVASFCLVVMSTIIVFFLCLIFKDSFASLVFGGNIKYVSYVLPTLMLSLQMGLTTLLYSYYRGADRFLIYSISQCTISFGLMIISIVVNELLLMVYVISIAGVLFSCFSFWRVWKTYRNEGCTIEKSDLGNEVRTLARYSVPRVPGEFVLFSFTTVPLIIINQKVGPEQAVAFSVALGIISAISPFFRYIGMVLLPYASKSIANDNFDDLDRKMKYLSILYAGISICGILFVLIFARFVIVVLYSSEYVQYAETVRIMIFSLLPNAIYLLLRNPLDALAKFPINTINLIVSFCIMNIIIYLSNSIKMYALSFFIAYTILGSLSWISWLFLKRTLLKRNN
ncbi:lipopolysaccharide biosynthesis protein [Enterococcus avium]|nr:lipopolysaccharide biosynthesis protein [Enterococcus avium]